MKAAIKLAVLFALSLAVGAVTAQSPPSSQSRTAGRYVASYYGQWSTPIYKGTTATGSQTITVSSGFFTTTDNRSFVPFNTNAPLKVGTEIVTPSAVSGCTLNDTRVGICTITATFAQVHSNSDQVSSGTYGLQEALNDAGISGGTVTIDAYWTQLGGTSAMVSAATSPTHTGIEDERTGPATAGITLGTVLRAGMASAVQTNAVLTGALSAPSNWAASHAYVQGNVVVNGGNYYFCFSAGTSASSGGPTGTGSAQITDGTVGWYWYGYMPPYVSGVAPAFSEVTSDPSGLTNSYLNTTSLNPALTYSGGTPVNLGAPDWAIQNANGSSNPGGNDVSMCWLSDAPKLVVYGYSAYPARVLIDGQFSTYGGIATTFQSGDARTVIDWSNISKVHQYTMVSTVGSGGSQWFGGVKVDPLHKVWPCSPSPARLCLFGDSIVVGSTNAPLIAGETWPFLLAQQLGITDVRDMAIAGTGYITGTSSAYTIQNAISNNVTSSSGCSVVVFSAGHNDPSISATAIQAAALLAFQTVRGLFPTAPIIVTGVWPGSTGSPSNYVTIETAVQAAVTQFGDANTYFIPEMLDANGYWITGSGNISSTNGTGNADVYIASDATHPEQNGIYYYAGQLLPKFKAIFNKVP